MTQLLKGLSFFDAFSLVVGSMIGTGVFLKSAAMSQALGSSGLVLLAWCAAGLLSLSGAFTYAEIGSRFPKAGGEYVYLREAYGKLPAFLFGWTRFWIASTGSVAAYGVGAATFLSAVVDLKYFGGKTTVALFFIALYTIANCLTVSFGGKIQAFMTSIKMLLILSIAIGVAVSIAPGKGNLFPIHFESTATNPISAFGMAMLAALWAFDGWNNLPMAAGEVKNGTRNVPLALALGTLIVLVLYLLINVAYFHALPFNEVITSSSNQFPDALPVAAKAAQSFLGPVAATFLSIMFVFSALGAMNGSILTGARVPYAMAKDGIFFHRFSQLNEKTHVPVFSVVIQGVWACVLALSGTFDQLTDSVVFSSWIFYGAVTYSIFLLRKRTDVPVASFRTWGYPYLPIVFLLSTVFLLINTVISSPKETAVGLVLISLGVPAYYYFKRGSKHEETYSTICSISDFQSKP